MIHICLENLKTVTVTGVSHLLVSLYAGKSVVHCVGIYLIIFSSFRFCSIFKVCSNIPYPQREEESAPHFTRQCRPLLGPLKRRADHAFPELYYPSFLWNFSIALCVIVMCYWPAFTFIYIVQEILSYSDRPLTVTVFPPPIVSL